MSNSYGRQVVLSLTNKSGGGVVAGDVVVLDSANDDAFTTTTSAGSTVGVGVAQETIASNAVGRVLVAGHAALVNVAASVTRGNYGTTHTVAKQATSTASRTTGTFCRFLKGGTTPSAWVYPPDLNGTAVTVATDTIWDTAGDIAVATGADTAAKLAIGNAGAQLARINGTVQWDSRTSMPTAASGDRVWRSDLNLEFYYDGTRWLSTQLFKHQIIPRFVTGASTGDMNTVMSATSSPGRVWSPSIGPGTDFYIVSHFVTFKVNSGGTALGASHKWVGTLVGFDTSEGSTGTVDTTNVDSGSSGVWRTSLASINALRVSGTLFYQTTWTKTGTPGNLQVGQEFYYRIVAT